MKPFTKRLLSLLLTVVMLVGILPLQSLAVVRDGETINVKVGESFEDFAGTPPQWVSSCRYCGADVLSYTPDSQSDYLNVSVTSSNDGVLSDLTYGFKNAKISSDPDHVYEAITVKFKGVKAGTTTITVRFAIDFRSAFYNQFGVYGGWTNCGSCYNEIYLQAESGLSWITRTFTVNVTEPENPETTYTLTYDANGGEGAPAAETVTEATDSHEFTVSSTEPTREGYTFKGWADTTDATVAGYIAGDPVNVTKDAPSKTVYAVWEKVPTYTVTYTDGVDGEEIFADQETEGLKAGDATPAFAGTPTRDGYEFKGWEPEVAATVSGNVTYTAQWAKKYTYTLLYVNGADNFHQDSITTTETSHKFTVIDQVPEREGYDFLGWADTADAAEPAYSTEITLTSDAPEKTVYAVWQKKVDNQYTLTYVPNAPATDVSGMPKNEKASDWHDSHTFTLTGAPTRNGYTFKGWAEKDDKVITSIEATKANPNVTVYAVWEEILPEEYDYTLTYDGNKPADAPATSMVSGVPEGKTETSTEESHVFTLEGAPTLYGYVFKGWAAAKDSTTAISEIEATKDNRDVTVYAIWTKEVPHEHNFVWVSIGAVGHRGECTCGEVTEPEAHTWGEWKVTKAATCGEKGEETRTCSKCGATETKDIDATGEHKWEEITTAYEAPTYTTEGKRVFKCTVCGAEKTEILPKLNPQLPTLGDLEGLDLDVNVVCKLDETHNQTVKADFSSARAKDLVVAEDGTCTCTVILDASKYLTEGHKLMGTQSEEISVPMIFDREAGKWVLNAESVSINTECVYVTFTLTFDDNAVATEMVENMPEDVTAEDFHNVHTFDLTKIEKPTRKGYTCVGWSAEPNGEVIESIEVSKDDPKACVYAVWEVTTYDYTLTYNANKPTEAPATSDVKNMPENVAVNGTTAESNKFELTGAPELYDYEFKGWATDPNGTDPITEIEATKDNRDVTVYAIWAKKAAHEHSYTWTEDSNGTHTGECECGDTINEPHTWDEGIVTKEPTCAEAGVKTYTCDKCGATKTEEIPATGEHDWNEITTAYEAPTYTKEGKRVYKCTVCGEEKTETLPKLIPVLPTLGDLGNILGDVKINLVCTVEGSHSKTAELVKTSFGPAADLQQDENGNWITSTTLYVDQYAEQCEETGHKLVGTQENITVPLVFQISENGETGTWKAAVESVDILAYCEIVYHTVTFDAVGGTPAPEAQTVEAGKLATKPADPEKNDYVFDGWYNGDTLYDFDAPVTGDITLTAKWTKLCSVHVVIYRNGNTDKAYKDVFIGQMKKGEALDVSTLNIADYYDKDSVFEGWYNDGGWNAYKNGNPNNTISKPITINGYTNIICMVTDYEAVNVKAVYDGDKENAQNIYTGKALHGANLLEFLNANVTVEEKAGYTLDKWYNWDWFGHKYDDKKTVSGWTNVYVTYTANEYTVSFDAGEGNTVDPASKTVTFNSAYGELPVPVHANANYVFDGWTLNGEPVTAETVVTTAGDHTLVATWDLPRPAYPKDGHNISDNLYIVQCTTNEAHHTENNAFIYVNTSRPTNNDLAFNEETGRWEITVKICLERFVNTTVTMNRDFGGMKHYMPDGQSIASNRRPEVKLYWDPTAEGETSLGEPVVGLWKAVDGNPVTINVKCYDKPAAPNAAKLSGNMLWLRDCDKLATNQKYTLKQMLDGSYELGEVYKEGNDFYCNLKINAAPYVEAFNTKYGGGYTLCDMDGHTADQDKNHTEASALEYTFKLKYTGSKTDFKQDGTGWSVDTTDWSKSDKNNGKAIYLSNDYTVTFDAGEGNTVEPASKRVEFNTAYGELPVPVHANANYVFAGWTLNGEVVTAETVMTKTENHTLVATWDLPRPAYPKDGHNISDNLYVVQCTTDEKHRTENNAFIEVNTSRPENNDLAFNEETGRWEITVKIALNRFVNTTVTMNRDFGGRKHYHTDGQSIASNRDPKIKLYWDPTAEGATSLGEPVVGLWKAVDGNPVTLNVMCYDKPAAPKSAANVATTLSSKMLWLRDSANTSNSWKPTSKEIKVAPYADTLTFGEVYTEGGNFYCNVTVANLKPYIEYFNSKYPQDCPYVLDTENDPYAESGYVFVLKYTGSKTDYKQDGTGWTRDDTKTEFINIGTNLGQGGNKLNGKIVWLKQDHKLTHVEAVAPTCGDDGNVEYWYCSACGKYYSDEACTKEIAKDAIVIPATGDHQWDKGVITTPPTLESDGVRTYTCTVCGDTKTEIIPKPTPITEDIVEHENQPAFIHVLENYSAEGKKPELYGYLGREDDGRERVDGSPIRGTYRIGTPYEENGSFYCNVTIFDLQPYLDWFIKTYPGVEWKIDEANSQKTYEYRLKYIGYDYPADPCTWRLERMLPVGSNNTTDRLWITHEHYTTETTKWKVTTPATCTEDGVETATCAHNASNGSYKPSYTACKVKLTRPIPATGHNLTHVEALAPTCETAGNIEYWYCSNCGKYFTDEACTKEVTVEETILAPIGHDWKGIGTVAATCTTPEYTTYQCQNDPHHIKQDVSGEALGHDYETVVTAPTCTTGGYTTYTCKRCNESHVDDITEPTGHTWDEGKVIKGSDCTSDGVKEYTCTVCGEKKQENIGATGHTYVDTKHEATCTDCGWITHTCSVCGYTYDSDHVAALGHKYEEKVVAPTCTAAGYTEYTCSVCSDRYTDHIVQPTGHKYEKVVEDPTCTELGKTWEVCSVCGDKRLVDATNALGHNFEEEWTIDVPATCETDGSKSHHCTRCEEKADVTVIPATGHDWDEGTVVTPATCTEDGVMSFVCKNDSKHTKTEVIPATGHSWSEEWTIDVPAECEKEGSKSHHCTACDEKTDVTVIPATGHDWDEGEITTPATCEEEGVKTFTCKNDPKHTKTEKVEATGHDWDEGEITTPATCEEEGVKTFTCKNDPKHTKTEKVEATGHDWDEGKITTAATCEAEGVKTYTCKNDETHTKTEAVAAIGHDWDEGKITTAATCTKEGVKTITCKNDASHTKTEVVPAAGHKASDWKYDNSKHWQVCTVCGEIIDGSKTAHVDGNGNHKCDVCGKELTKENYDVAAKTGDPAPVALTVTILLISAAGICFVLYFDRKKRAIQE